MHGQNDTLFSVYYYPGTLTATENTKSFAYAKDLHNIPAKIVGHYSRIRLQTLFHPIHIYT